MSFVGSRSNRIKAELIEIYDRLLELYVLADEAWRRGDDTESERLQPEIDRLQATKEHLKLRAGSA